jgi:hypothetical protein
MIQKEMKVMIILTILSVTLKTIIIGFSIFGMYIFAKVVQIAYLQTKIKEAHSKLSAEEARQSMLDFAEKHNKKFK